MKDLDEMIKNIDAYYAKYNITKQDIKIFKNIINNKKELEKICQL